MELLLGKMKVIWLDCRLFALVKLDFLCLAVEMVMQLRFLWEFLLDSKS